MNLLALAFSAFLVYAVSGNGDIPDPTTEIEVQYLTTGLANYVSVRCGWSGPSGATVRRIDVLGPDTSSGVLGTVNANGATINVDSGSLPTVEGTVDCSANRAGCKNGETAYAFLKWPRYVVTWSSPVYHRYGCQVVGDDGNNERFGKRVTTEYRIREDEQNGAIDPRITSDDMHFRLRGGLNSGGSVKYLFMRCAALKDGFNLKSIVIYRPDGTILSGVYANGTVIDNEAPNARTNYLLDCASSGNGCGPGETAYLSVIWTNMDVHRDIGNQRQGDHFRLSCDVDTAEGHDAVLYSQYRTVRVSGGLKH